MLPVAAESPPSAKATPLTTSIETADNIELNLILKPLHNQSLINHCFTKYQTHAPSVVV
jgi:hypothetical protein